MSAPPDLDQLLLLNRIATALERLVKIECLRHSSTVDAMEEQYAALSAPSPPLPDDEPLQSESDTARERARFRDAVEKGYAVDDTTDLDATPWDELQDDRRGR